MVGWVSARSSVNPVISLRLIPSAHGPSFASEHGGPPLVAAPDVCRICNKSFFFFSLQHLGMMMVRARCLQDLRRIPLLLHRRRRRRPNPQPMGDPSGPMMGRPSHHNSTVPTPVGRLFNQTSCKMFDRFSNVENLH